MSIKTIEVTITGRLIREIEVSCESCGQDEPLNDSKAIEALRDELDDVFTDWQLETWS